MANTKIERLDKNIQTIQKILNSLNVPEKVLEREVKSFGNGGHVIIPKEHLDKKVKIIVG
jgi:putative transposon-encoded protein